jgi:hypothetical protein
MDSVAGEARSNANGPSLMFLAISVLAALTRRSTAINALNLASLLHGGPLLSEFLAETPETYHTEGFRAGEYRHLNFHETWDDHLRMMSRQRYVASLSTRVLASVLPVLKVIWSYQYR